MSDFIRYYDDMLTKEQCDSLVDTTKNLMSIQSKGVKHTVGDRDYHRLVDELYSEEQRLLIENVAENVYKKYENDFTLNKDYSTITNKWKVHYTPVGGYIGWHNDLGGRTDESWKRKIVFIIYLNDLSSGELQLKYFPDIQIMPKAGRVLIMPTGWVWTHKAEKMFEEKYIINGFYYDKEDKC